MTTADDGAFVKGSFSYHDQYTIKLPPSGVLRRLRGDAANNVAAGELVLGSRDGFVGCGIYTSQFEGWGCGIYIPGPRFVPFRPHPRCPSVGYAPSVCVSPHVHPF
eukprot:353924-Chlamydomonas_euryale.AAC.3